MQADLSVALCICTRNRLEDLRRCLQSVANGDALPNQVIVSDDGDAGKTAKDVAAAFPFVQYQTGPHRGLGANRNACLASVTSRYVAFVDDDVVLPNMFFAEARKLAERYASHQPAPIVTGVEWKHTAAGVQRVEPGNADFWGFQRLPPNGVLRAIVINAAIFPSSLFAVAQFDAQLRYGSDEIDIARHATALGYTIVFEPALYVNHHPSHINRTEYAMFIDASRMYATAKHYWAYQGKVFKAIVFMVLAPARLMVALGRRSGLSGVKHSLQATVTAYLYTFKALRGTN